MESLSTFRSGQDRYAHRTFAPPPSYEECFSRDASATPSAPPLPPPPPPPPPPRRHDPCIYAPLDTHEHAPRRDIRACSKCGFQYIPDPKHLGKQKYHICAQCREERCCHCAVM